LTESNVKTASSREAATAGANAHTTYGKKNYSKPKRASNCYLPYFEPVNPINSIADMRQKSAQTQITKTALFSNFT